MTARVDLTGLRFGRLLVIEFSHSDGQQAHWNCRCDCRTEKTARGKDLRRGFVVSCGCLRREKVRTLKLAHGQRWTRAYKCWLNMRNRCLNPNSSDFKNYGGRGIGIDDPRWHSFVNFRDDMGDPPEGLTLDRRDNERGYSKENCRWTTRLVQNHNRRRK